MGLTAGIVGMPNVGKSTILNALSRAHAEIANYPFCTIEKNIGTAVVPDLVLPQLEKLLKPQEAIYATVELVDIAGLVPGASRGLGLGNRFLSEIRQVDAILHVVRCFEDENVSHIQGQVDPLADLELIETELALSDLERVERAREKVQRDFSTEGRKGFAALEKVQAALAQGLPLRNVDLTKEEAELICAREYLTAKPVLYVANVGEDGLYSENPGYKALCQKFGAKYVFPISAKLEEESALLTPQERAEFLAELGFTEDSLPRLISATFELLGLIRFYTFANHKLRAWETPAGTTAYTAAGKIHTDIQAGFIRAEIIRLEDLQKHPSLPELRRMGLVESEGKDYQIQDQDLVHFLFSN